MKLEQSFEVAAPLDRVWNALIDVEHVAPCLPGAAVTGRNDDGSYNGEIRIKIGPTTANYAGKLEMQDIDESARAATMYANGTDKRGQGGATATITSTLHQEGGVTRVDVVTDYHITGRLARFGRGGMIEDVSKRLLREFAKRLQDSLTGAPAAGPDLEPATAEAPAAPANPVAPPTAAAPPTPAESPISAAPASPPSQATKLSPARSASPGNGANAPSGEASSGDGAEEPEVPAAEEPEVPAAEEPPALVGEEPPSSPAASAPEPPASAPGPPASAPEPPVAAGAPTGVAGAPPAPEPPTAPQPGFNPPQPAEPIEGLSLAASILWERTRRNPLPLIAGLVLALLLLRRARR
jgi:uncharacterized protein